MNAPVLYSGEVQAIDWPGNPFLSDSCQNPSSAYCLDLARQGRSVSCVLVG